MRSTEHPLETDGPEVEGLEFGAAHAGLMISLRRHVQLKTQIKLMLTEIEKIGKLLA